MYKMWIVSSGVANRYSFSGRFDLVLSLNYVNY
jgi:hypothetical protein